MKFTRSISSKIESRFFTGKAILVFGPRQVGKTTLIKTLLGTRKESVLFLDGDDPTVRNLLSNANTERIRELIANNEIIFIDEAQRISGIGLTAKIIVDQFKNKQLILSGSSAFELNTEVNEALTGRKWTFNLLPISWEEWQNTVGFLKSEQGLESRLIYGFYPDILINTADQDTLLYELVESYLFKDVLAYAGIRKPDLIQKIVRALAFQVGSEVVYKEIADLVGVDPKTVASYIDVLEKAFVVFHLPSFSRNLRNEIKTNRKYYFFDNGVRNAIIQNLNPLTNRDDIGALWENFLVAERMKVLRHHQIKAQNFFWRTKQQQEIDYIEEQNAALSAFEFKWNPKKKVRFPKTFTENYKADCQTVHRANFREFILPNS